MSDTEISILEYSEDVSKAEAPAPLPVRQYPGTIEKAEVKTSATSGNQYVSVTFRISADDFPADFDATGYDDGVILSFNRIPVDDSPRSRYRMRQFCEAIGAKASKKIDLGEWIGLTATLDVEHNTYEGETRAQIKKVLAA